VIGASDYDLVQLRRVHEALLAYRYGRKTTAALGALVGTLEGLNAALESPPELWAEQFDAQFTTLETVYALRREARAPDLEPDQAALVEEAVATLSSIVASLTPVVELPLGPPGLAIVRAALAGGRSLLRALLERVDEGRATGLVPRGTLLERALRVEEGGLLGRSDGVRALATAVAPAMRASGCVFVAAHQLLERRDPAVGRPSERASVSFFGDEVYYWTLDPAGIDAVVRAAASWGATHLVTHAPQGLPEELDAASLERLANEAQLVALDAYDEESFVLWRPGHALRSRSAGPGAERGASPPNQ
jgi:hypothetical protein